MCFYAGFENRQWQQTEYQKEAVTSVQSAENVINPSILTSVSSRRQNQGIEEAFSDGRKLKIYWYNHESICLSLAKR